jgi:hypothetical protein
MGSGGRLMSRWFRHYAGMMRDDKLVRVAVKSRQPVERVVWLYGAMLESACEMQDGGRFDIDADEVAYFLRCEADDIAAIIAALQSTGRIDGDCIPRWSDRQFESDASRERVRKHREKKAQRSCNGGETLQPVTVTLQETETETDTKEEEKKEPPSVPSAPQTPAGVGSKAKGHRIPDGWQPSEGHFALAEELGQRREWVADQAERMRDWAISNSNRPIARKADWNATFRNWMKSNASDPKRSHQNRNGGSSGHHAGQPRGFDAVLSGMARVAHQRGLTERERDERLDEAAGDPGFIDADWRAAGSH